MKAQFVITGDFEYTADEIKDKSKDEIAAQITENFRQDLDGCDNLEIKITLIE